VPLTGRRLRLDAYGALLVVGGVTACAGPRHPEILGEPDRALAAVPAPDSFRVAFETSQGEFVVRVRRSWAPLGTDRFYALVRHGFFDGQRFFRVRKGFIAQTGMHGDPRVIAAWKGRTIPDDPPRVTNRRGTLAYAFTTPGTRTTQIYINLADNARLDSGGFAPFGEIVSGVEVIDRLYSGYDESAGGGVRAGRQGPLEQEGNAWLSRHFPRLDRIERARLVP
jgi:cyclophilin family peptidyl-prolyl cis-trans isomerase